MAPENKLPPRGAADEAARLLATEEGTRLFRLLQMTGVVTEPAPPATPAAPAAQDGEPEPIGIWEPSRTASGVEWVRPDPLELEDDWPPAKVLRAKQAFLPIRVVLLGESAAAGYLYAPQLTPARVLEDQLRELRGPGLYEVVDLCKVDQDVDGLLRTGLAATQLAPDVLVVFAGNNWAGGAMSTPSEVATLPLAAVQEQAAALEEGGVAGLRALASGWHRALCEDASSRLGRLSEASGVPMVLVVPEANKADWEHGQPVAWLPGDRTARWHGRFARGLAALEAGDLEAAEAEAREMLALDDGSCSASHRLLGRALAGLGRERDAAAAFGAEMDASKWLGKLAPPAASSAVREALSRTAAEHGLARVDLPAVFAEHTGAASPGRRMFIDYCHLSVEGMKVAMAAVAAEVLRLSEPAGPVEPDWRKWIARLPDPRISPEADARGMFLGALHTAHMMKPVTGSRAVVEHGFERALDASPGIADAMLDYIAARCAQAPAVLTAAQRRIHGSPYRLPMRVWRWQENDVLDAEVIEAIRAVLERRGRRVGAEIDRMLVEAHALSEAPVDLSRPFWRGSPLRGYDARQPHERAALPRTHYHFVARGPERDVAVEITVRAPRGGTVRLSVNGSAGGSIELGERWTRARLAVKRELLRPGLNALQLEWPALPMGAPLGDAMLRRAVERFQLGLAAEMRPLFGELYALRARTA